MKKYYLLFVVYLTMGAVPLDAQSIICSYRARLSSKDHVNSSGARLLSAAAIIRQDRANYHVYGIRDQEDQDDAYFLDKKNRENIDLMLGRASMTTEGQRQIVEGEPLVEVKVIGDINNRLEVAVIGDQDNGNSVASAGSERTAVSAGDMNVAKTKGVSAFDKADEMRVSSDGQKGSDKIMQLKNWLENNFARYMLYASPVLIGLLITTINVGGLNDLVEKISVSFVDKVKSSKKSGRFYGLVLKLPLSLMVKFIEWTDSVSHKGMRSGVRVALVLYLVGIWIALIFWSVMIVLAVVTVMAAFWVTFKIIDIFDGDGFSKGSNQPLHAGRALRGKRIYKGDQFYNRAEYGKIDEDGNIYKGDQFYNRHVVGKVDEDGDIYEGDQFYNRKLKGKMKE